MRPAAAPTRAVVVGTGFGARVHVPALRAAGFDVVALVGRDRDRTERRAVRAGVPAAHTSLGAALDATRPDVVTVATPPATHAPLVLEAVAAGCHVLCEKPFALDAVEAGALRDAAADAGAVGVLGHEFRWAPERAACAEAIAEGRIGRPRLALFAARMSLVADPAVVVPEWWFDRAQGGGWLGASGSHAVDMIRWWLGDIVGLSAHLDVVSDRESDVDDSFDVRFRTLDGVEGTLLQTAGAWGAREDITWVAGDRATVWIQDERPYLADATSANGSELPMAAAAPDAGRERTADRGPALYPSLCRAFRAAISGGPADPRLPTFADAVRTMAVLDAIRRSDAAGGTWVHVTDVSMRTDPTRSQVGTA